MKYNVKLTLKKIEKLKKPAKVYPALRKNGFNANMFIQSCNRRRNLKKKGVKSVKDAIALMNFELES